LDQLGVNRWNSRGRNITFRPIFTLYYGKKRQKSLTKVSSSTLLGYPAKSPNFSYHDKNIKIRRKREITEQLGEQIRSMAEETAIV